MKIQFKNLPDELKTPLKEIDAMLPLEIAEDGVIVEVQKTKSALKSLLKTERQ